MCPCEAGDLRDLSGFKGDLEDGRHHLQVSSRPSQSGRYHSEAVNCFIRSFQNLTVHRCYRQLSCPPEAFSSLALRRGPQSHSSESDLAGGQQCQKRVLIPGSVIAGPGLEAVNEDVTDRKAPGQPHASPQFLPKSFKRAPDWQLHGIPLPGSHFALQELCSFFS